MKTACEAFKKVRDDIKAQIGVEGIKALHKQKPWLDWSMFALITVLFFSLMFALNKLPAGLLWVSFLIAQGFVMQGFGLFAHDAFSHRRVGGKALSYIGDLLSTIPYFRLPTLFYCLHLRHHKYLNEDKDPEVQVIEAIGRQTKAKKIIFFTFIGAFLTIFKGERLEIPSKYSAKIRREKKLRVAFCIFIVLSTFLFPGLLFYGYWLPILITLPTIRAFRILLEHAEINPDNPIQAITNYRSGIIFRILHLFNSGDCHLLHHIYPNVPFYNVPKAMKLLRPYLVKCSNIYEHSSLFSLLYSFFVKNKNFKEFWGGI